MESGWTTKVETETPDPVWDEFVARHPAGRFVQSGLWAAVKAENGWGRLCVQICGPAGIIAGAQVLTRRLPAIGRVGYAIGAPLLGNDESGLRTQCLDAVLDAVRRARIAYFLIQPGQGDELVTAALVDSGFQPDISGSIISASVQIDLRAETEELFRNLRSRNQKQIQKGLDKGLRIREGGFDDLATLHRLMLSTCARQGVPPHPASVEFFEHMWRHFDRAGAIRLLLASHQGRDEAVQLMVQFGPRMSAFKVGWSGAANHLSPVKVLDWMSIQLAKSKGSAIYDFMGVDPKALTIERSQWRQLPGPTFYKLGFGGQIISLPQPLEFVANPVLRTGYRVLVRPLRASRRLRAASGRLWSRLHRA